MTNPDTLAGGVKLEDLLRRLSVAADGIEKVSFDRRSIRRGYEELLREAAAALAALPATWAVKPDYWALHSKSGSHIGLWADEETAQRVALEYTIAGTVITPLFASPPKPSEAMVATHRHVKRGSEYELIGYGKMQAEHWYDDTAKDGSGIVDMREVAIYRSVDDGSLWVRPREEFEDGRFIALTAALSGGAK